MLVYKHLGDFCGPFYMLIKLFLKTRLCHDCAPNACIQAPGRFLWTILYVHEAFSQDTVVPRLCAKCLYTSIWGICLPHVFPTLLFTYQLAVDFKPGVPLIHGRHMHRQHERAAGVPRKCNDLVHCNDLTFSRRAQCKASS